MKLAISGASGTLGRLVADQLLADPQGNDVVLLSRDPSQLTDLEARGAELRRVDFGEPATFGEAFAGVDRLLLISLDAIGDRVPKQVAAIDAAVAAGVGHIAYTSITNPSDSHPGAVAAEHRATEQHLHRSGATWTFLRNAIYTEMLVVSGALQTGSYVTNDGDGRRGYVARADCAAAAVAVLTGAEHAGRAYDITGSEALSSTAAAALLGELAGVEIEVVDVDDASYAAGLVEHAGMPQELADALAGFGAAARNGYLGTVSDAVERLTGRPPRTTREALSDALAASGASAT